ncbi:Uma2 family endonuclease [Pseudanabaena sp. ABRG5-3]|uniref:Uma2 family endonuclease n=1 Tax=Pseudanabaena sp. ABRG5-3 TaxID=685565 RepID=UPI001CED5841|nr:Uma2 family endonuclease [Pseudanabaena sp. ABRG5-3]
MIKPMVSPAIAEKAEEIAIPKISLDEWVNNPPDGGWEWVSGNLIEKTGMTLQHGRVQSRVARIWGNHIENSGIGGEVYTEVPCRTLEQGRRPDVAYLTPDLLAAYGDLPTLPQSFPLIAEVISPTDAANDVFAKAYEYLRSQCQEVWLIFNEERLIVVLTQDSRKIYVADEVITSVVLNGFSMTVNELLPVAA